VFSEVVLSVPFRTSIPRSLYVAASCQLWNTPTPDYRPALVVGDRDCTSCAAAPKTDTDVRYVYRNEVLCIGSPSLHCSKILLPSSGLIATVVWLFGWSSLGICTRILGPIGGSPGGSFIGRLFPDLF
jgi:hypothetical protein